MGAIAKERTSESNYEKIHCPHLYKVSRVLHPARESNRLTGDERKKFEVVGCISECLLCRRWQKIGREVKAR